MSKGQNSKNISISIIQIFYFGFKSGNTKYLYLNFEIILSNNKNNIEKKVFFS